MNTTKKSTAKNKPRKLWFSSRMIMCCITMLAFSLVLVLDTNAQLEVVIKGTDSLQIQDEPGAPQEPGKNIIVEQPDSTDVSSINDNVDWMLMLVNGENPLPVNYSPKLKRLHNGLEFDERAIEQLNAQL